MLHRRHGASRAQLFFVLKPPHKTRIVTQAHTNHHALYISSVRRACLQLRRFTSPHAQNTNRYALQQGDKVPICAKRTSIEEARSHRTIWPKRRQLELASAQTGAPSLILYGRKVCHRGPNKQCDSTHRCRRARHQRERPRCSTGESKRIRSTLSRRRKSMSGWPVLS